MTTTDPRDAYIAALEEAGHKLYVAPAGRELNGARDNWDAIRAAKPPVLLAPKGGDAPPDPTRPDLVASSPQASSSAGSESRSMLRRKAAQKGEPMPEFCPTCGSSVRVESSDEGTSYYVPAAAQSGAERHYAEFRFTCDVATANKLYDLMWVALEQWTTDPAGGLSGASPQKEHEHEWGKWYFWGTDGGPVDARRCRCGKVETRNRSATEKTADDRHYIEFSETKWAIQHPLSCRPNLLDCAVHHAVEEVERENAVPPMPPGRYLIDFTDEDPVYLPLDSADEKAYAQGAGSGAASAANPGRGEPVSRTPDGSNPLSPVNPAVCPECAKAGRRLRGVVLACETCGHRWPLPDGEPEPGCYPAEDADDHRHCRTHGARWPWGWYSCEDEFGPSEPEATELDAGIEARAKARHDAVQALRSEPEAPAAPVKYGDMLQSTYAHGFEDGYLRARSADGPSAAEREFRQALTDIIEIAGPTGRVARAVAALQAYPDAADEPQGPNGYIEGKGSGAKDR